jgi:hypothetical protein
MGKTFSMYGREKNARRVLVGKPDGKGPLRRQDIGERMILKWILEKQDVGMDCIHLAQDIDQRPAPVNTVTNLRVP